MLIPHVFEGPAGDQKMCQILGDRFTREERVKVIETQFNACQLKYIISTCDYFIGARTHSTIASLSSAVPTVTIGYSTKAYGMNKDIFGHTDYVIPIAELNESVLWDKFSMMRKRKEEIKNHLKTEIPKLKQKADRGGDYLRQVLQNHGKLP